MLGDWVEDLMSTRKVNGGQRWHQDIAILKRGKEKRYVWLLRGRGRKGRPILLSAMYTTNRKDEHAENLLKQAKERAESLPRALVSDGEHSFKRAYVRNLSRKRGSVRTSPKEEVTKCSGSLNEFSC